MISVTNDVRARFIDAEHHKRAFSFRKRIAVEEGANDVPHQREISGVAGELHFLLHRPHEAGTYTPPRASPQPKRVDSAVNRVFYSAHAEIVCRPSPARPVRLRTAADDCL